MSEEIFRAFNVTIEDSPNTFLRHFSLEIYQGEILGIYSLFDESKSAIKSLFSCNLSEFSSGSVYYYGEKVSCNDEFRRLPKIYFTTKNNKIFPEMTVWENIMLMNWEKEIYRLFSKKSLKNYSEFLIKKYELHISADDIIMSLREVECFETELLKARILGADLVFVSDFSLKGSLEDFTELKKFIRRLNKEGMSFVLISHNFQLLSHFADRIAFFSDGSIIKTENVGESALKIFHNVAHDVNEYDDSTKGFDDSHPVYTFDQLKDSEGRSLRLYSGEIIEVTNIKEKTMKSLEQSARHSDSVIVLNAAISSQIIPELTIEENIAGNKMKKLTKFCIIRKASVNVLLREFAAWYPKGKKIIHFSNCVDIDHHDSFAVILYRILSLKPRVLVCCGTGNDLDHVSRLLMIRLSRELAAKGCAVAFLDHNSGDYGFKADKSFRVDAEDKISLYDKRPNEN